METRYQVSLTIEKTKGAETLMHTRSPLCSFESVRSAVIMTERLLSMLGLMAPINGKVQKTEDLGAVKVFSHDEPKRTIDLWKVVTGKRSFVGKGV